VTVPETASLGRVPPGPGIEGLVIIEWPGPAGPWTSSALPGWGVSIYDATTRQQITTASGAVIHADSGRLVTADLTLFTDEAGNPVFDAGFPEGTVYAQPDGEIATAVFTFLVTEMRIRK
jgi:hypothetical protein